MPVPPHVERPHELLVWTLLLAITVHFSIIALYNLPPNPISQHYRTQILAYVHPAFDQLWNFFAPTPVEQDMTAWVRAETADGRRSAWLDITTPLIDDVRHNPLTVNSDLKLDLMTAIVAIVNDSALNGERTDARARRRLARFATQPETLQALERFAAASIAGSTAGSRRLQVAVVVHQFPRFTHRDEADDKRAKTRFIEFPVVDIPEVSPL